MSQTPPRLYWLIALCILGLVGSGLSQVDQVMYTDSLVNGWQDWSWATVNLQNASPFHSGSNSISVTATAWQALYLHHDAFDISGYTNLIFWIHGGASGGQRLQVQALLNGVAQPAVSLAPLATNAWQQITLSLGSLGAASQPNVDGFWIQDRSGTTQPAFYVDDIRLTALPPPSVVNLNVDAAQIVRTLDARLFGVNAVVWDGVFDTPTTLSLLTEMDTRALRFPGGSLSDEYHWASNTSGTNTWTWATSFDEFAHIATNTHAQVFLTADYGSGTPTEAANWVRYSNVTKPYAFQYWEIGNENYGTWEPDANTRPHDPYTYATRFQAYFNQMKAVDASIKVGAVVVTGEDSYTNYTDHSASNPRTGQTHNGWTPVLLATLKTLGVIPDFISYHRYAQNPGGESDVGLLQSSGTWATDAADLRQQLTDYLGAAATNVELVCTENNSVSSGPGKQTTSLVNGLFLADSVAQAMGTEFNALIWWDLRNSQESGYNNDPSLYGWRLYGDYGVVNFASPAGPADRYPTFYAAKLLKNFARGGDQLVHATSDYSLLSVYAAKRTNGVLALLVINKSSTNALNASIALAGYLPRTNAIAYSYGVPQDEAGHTGVGSTDLAQTNFGSASMSFLRTFPAYSATVISLLPSYPPGDLNGDFHVTGGDSLLINQVMVGLRSSNSTIFANTGFANGDVNQNGQVTGGDSLLINQVMVGLRPYLVTKIVPNARSHTVPTAVTIYGIGFPTDSVSAVTTGPPVNLTLSNIVVVSREQIDAIVPAGGGLGTGVVTVTATPTNGVISFGRFINQ